MRHFTEVGNVAKLRPGSSSQSRDDDCAGGTISPVALFGLLHKTRLHFIGIQYSTPDGKSAGILLQGDKDNYRAILVALQGITGVPVSVGEKDREFIPVGVRTDVSKANEEDSGAKKSTNASGDASSSSTKGKVNVFSTPPSADVYVDGNFVGNSPAALELAAGKHTITVKTAGYKDWSREITIQSGSDVQLTASMERQN